MSRGPFRKEPDDPLRKLADQIADKERKSSAVVNMAFGSILLLVGIGVTVYSYSRAAPGGKFVVAGGFIIVGLFYLVARGIIQYFDEKMPP